jgi:signal transduction histidine kinase
MRSLYLRIWLTVVAALALFALASGWLVQRHLDEQRSRLEQVAQERLSAWADLLQRSLPEPGAPPAEVQAALQEWSLRLRVPMALDDAGGRRVAASESFLRRDLDRPAAAAWLLPIRLDDGRTLWVPRPGLRRAGVAGGGGAVPGAGAGGFASGVPGGMPGALPPGLPPPGPGWLLPGPGARVLPEGLGLALLLLTLLLAVAAGAWPVVRRLTRRLEALKQGVEAFGAGQLERRVAEDGRDEVAALGAAFNRTATRIEALLRSHQSLLANASHELRSPLARLRLALALLDDAAPAQRGRLRREIDSNIGELDALVEEVLLASRLQAGEALVRRDEVALLALAAEEAARLTSPAPDAPPPAVVGGDDVQVQGDERLLRRALRNLLENARRYGHAGPAAGGAAGRADAPIEVQVRARPGGGAELRVCDRGPGVPEAWRERIFEPFFRLPGHAEREGGVGLGLALVRQIAQRHGGSARCEPRPGGGSCFVIELPAAAPGGAGPGPGPGRG